MNDDQLRSLVRAAIARHTGSGLGSAASAPPPSVVFRLHASHGMFTVLPTGTEADGPCLIEPTVTCNHCGYCQSHGH